MDATLTSFAGLSVGDRVAVFLAVRDQTYEHRLGTVRGISFETRFRIHVELDESANGRRSVISEQLYVRKLSLLELIALAAR